MSHTASTDFDTVIVGAGPVGCALALWLLRRRHDPQRLLLIDKNPVETSLNDPRALALSAGSLMLLRECVADQSLTGCDLLQVQVSQQGSLGQVRLSAQDMQLPCLGRVLRYADLMRSLLDALTARGLVIQRPNSLSHWHETTDCIEFATHTASYTTQVLIQAEGGLAQKHQSSASHQQTAIIAEVQSSRPRPNTAFERFTREGPLALLPLIAQQHELYSLVWCMSPAQAERRMLLTEHSFALELQQSFGQRLGQLTLCAPRQAYPLALIRRSSVGQRYVRVGNAAQILHPVAGQGLNLGLRDAYCLVQGWSQVQSWPKALRTYETSRKWDRLALTGLTELLARGFTWPLQPLTGVLLTGLDLWPAARYTLARTLIFGMR
jgi:2-octaprenyl-6-methoxyphenol hydroxylase